jgi:LL-diaminopimelate aminotransferase
LLWLNYPANPTGAVANVPFFERAAAFARQHDLLLAHDAAYSRVFFGMQPPPSIFQAEGAQDVAVEFNSLSKSHNMPGWRIGAMLGRADALAAVLRLKTNQDSGHFRPILEAAVAALETPDSWLAARNDVYARRLAVGLGAMPPTLRPYPPQAAIYVWCQVPEGWTSQDYARQALQRAHVSLTPGTVFGAGGEGYVRLSLTLPEVRLVEAMQRLRQV